MDSHNLTALVETTSLIIYGPIYQSCYDLGLGSDCNLGKDLNDDEENDQLVKHRNTR